MSAFSYNDIPDDALCFEDKQDAAAGFKITSGKWESAVLLPKDGHSRVYELQSMLNSRILILEGDVIACLSSAELDENKKPKTQMKRLQQELKILMKLGFSKEI